MLSNNGLCLRTATLYVLLFLVQFNNSDQFELYGVTRSYSSRPFLCALGQTYVQSIAQPSYMLNTLCVWQSPSPPPPPTPLNLASYIHVCVVCCLVLHSSFIVHQRTKSSYHLPPPDIAHTQTTKPSAVLLHVSEREGPGNATTDYKHKYELHTIISGFDSRNSLLI